jgi:hypothetical protein
MCVLCNQLWIDDHWSETAAGSQPDAVDGVIALEVHVTRRGQRLRDRSERARLVGLVLSTHAITLQDWEGSSYILRDPKGKTAVIHDLAAVWEAAEQMIGRPLDPLDPGFLEHLAQRASMQATG